MNWQPICKEKLAQVYITDSGMMNVFEPIDEYWYNVKTEMHGISYQVAFG